MNQSRLVDNLVEKGKWRLFAVGGTDSRRALYWNAIARWRSAEITARREACQQLPTSPLDIGVDRGFAICEFDTFDDTRTVVDEVRRIAGLHIPDSVVLETPDQFGANIRNLPFSSPLLRFALGGSLVASVASYLGMVPILAGVQIMRAPYVPGPPSGSQLYHCDHDDLRQVKVFVLCSEVSEENGPLTVLDASASRRVKRALHYRYGGRSLRVTDDQVAQLAASHERTEFSGSPGRVLLVDTSTCLHFGARVRKGAADRLMVQFQYLTPAAFEFLFQPSRRRISVPGSRSSAVQRLVLGA